MEHHNQSRGLNDSRQAAEIEERNADRQAARERAVLAEILDPLQAERLGPGLNVLRLQVPGNVEVVSVLAGTALPAKRPTDPACHPPFAESAQRGSACRQAGAEFQESEN